MAEVSGHDVTRDLRELAALVGSSWLYETAEGVLHRSSWVQFSDERLRQVTNEQGSALAKRHQEQAQQILQEAVSVTQVRAQREQRGPTARQEPPK